MSCEGTVGRKPLLQNSIPSSWRGDSELVVRNASMQQFVGVFAKRVHNTLKSSLPKHVLSKDGRPYGNRIQDPDGRRNTPALCYKRADKSFPLARPLLLSIAGRSGGVCDAGSCSWAWRSLSTQRLSGFHLARVASGWLVHAGGVYSTFDWIPLCNGESLHWFCSELPYICTTYGCETMLKVHFGKVIFIVPCVPSAKSVTQRCTLLYEIPCTRLHTPRCLSVVCHG